MPITTFTSHYYILTGGGEEGVQGAPEDKQVDRIVCERNFLETPSLCTPQITISVSHFPFVSLWIEN